MGKAPKYILDSKVTVELVGALIFYWSNCEEFYTDSRFSYYGNKNIELDYGTAEKLVLNFSEDFYPDNIELINFIDCLHSRWFESENIKKHYPNYYDFIKDIACCEGYYSKFCSYAYEYDEQKYVFEDFYDWEERHLTVDRYIVNGEIVFKDNDIIFYDFCPTVDKPMKKDSSFELDEEPSSPLETLLEEQDSRKRIGKLTSILKTLMGSGDE